VLTKSTLSCWWVLALLLLVPGCGGPVQRVDLQGGDPLAQQPVDETPEVLVVTLTGHLGTPELARCHRSIREAKELGCKYVIFRLDEAGSFEDDPTELQSLLDRMESSDVRTVAVLSRHVTYSAAALALSTDQTYCLSGVSWGEINKAEQEALELLSESPESAMARRLDAHVAMVKDRLEQRSRRLGSDGVKLALAMVDPRVQLVSATVREGGLERARVLDRDELAALQQSGATLIGEQPMTRPLQIDADVALEFGLSDGTLTGFAQLADILHFDAERAGELEVNWAEKMVAWLALLSPFLLIAGFLMLLIEMKTPGTGLPGLLGVVFLSLALFHSYLVGLAEVTEILVFFLGLAAIAVEIFLLPGTIVFGLVGFLCLLLSLILSRQSFVLPGNEIEEGILLANLANLTLLFLATGVVTFFVWRMLPKMPVFNRLMLVPPGRGREPEQNSEASGFGLDNDALVKLVGRVGTAATTLRPTGTMELDGDRVDVVTEGEFLANGTAIRVLYVQGNRVVVARDGDDPREGERGSVGLVVLLVVLGLAFIFLEVIFVTFGALGFGAAACLIGALFVAFQESVGFGVGMSIFEAFAAPTMIWLSFKILPKTPFGRRLILTGPPTDGKAASVDHRLDDLVGKTGTTLSALRPAGFARIADRKVDVVTRGEMIGSGLEVVVLQVSGNRVVVGLAKAPADAPADAPNT